MIGQISRQSYRATNSFSRRVSERVDIRVQLPAIFDEPIVYFRYFVPNVAGVRCANRK